MSAISNVSQLNDLRSYSRHWLGEFIDMYQAEECLWQNKHNDYSNHKVRNKAYDKLVEKLKEVEPNPDRAMVVRKINSLRSAFRREYRKSSAKLGYETRLWYYDKMLFISDKNHKTLSPAGSGSSTVNEKPPKRSLALSFDDDDSMEFETEEEQQQIETVVPDADSGSHQQTEVGTVTVSAGDCVTLVKSEEHHHQQQQEQQHHAQATHLQTATHTHSQPQHATAVKVLEITSLDSNSQREIQQAVSSLEQQHQMQQLQQQHQHHQSGHSPATAQLAQIQIAREHLQPLFGNTYSTATTTTHRQEDEYDAIGINVASKLRVMNATQRIIAEKLISDVLFNGQLDNLSINSALTQ